jgi:putative endonuclease
MEKIFCVYIITNKKNGVLYTGVTSNLPKRIYEHKNKIKPGFTAKYNLTRLVHYEVFGDAENAIHREKCIKEWKRQWKIDLIEKDNPDWRDLYPEIL